MPTETMLPVADIVEQCKSPGKGFERVELIPGSTYLDNSTVIVIPTRGMVHQRFCQAVLNLIAPMNQKRAIVWAAGHEVGKAYEATIGFILANPELSKWKYILTIEDDNLVPPDAHIRLLESIEAGKFDAVGGVYFTKGDINMPMAYGDPATYIKTGELEFRPRNLLRALAEKARVVPVNGLAMGCTLWRMDLFKQFQPPFFVTVADVVDGKGIQAYTQDLWACERFKRAGKTFAVDLRVRVGHLDVNTGDVY